jgi:transcriptional regulator with XRE-family HTH domain
MSIGQRIKASRKEMGISQLELAQKVGLSQPTLSDLENDMSKGSVKLASIAKALNVRPYWLETGRGTSSASDSNEPSETTGFSSEALDVAKAFDLIKSPAQKAAVLAQLRAFGVLD